MGESKQDERLPIRFILPEPGLCQSDRSNLGTDLFKALFKLQGLILSRKQLHCCWMTWRHAQSRGIAQEWTLMTPKPVRPGIISQHSDFPIDVKTEASTPSVTESGHKDFTSRHRSLESASTQTQEAEENSQSLQDLRSSLFPSFRPEDDFWEKVLTEDIENKVEKLKEYEKGVKEIGMHESAIRQGILRIDSFITRLNGVTKSDSNIKNYAQGIKSECGQIVRTTKEWLLTQEEKLRDRRKDLENVHLSLQSRNRIHQLETRCECLLYPQILDLRTEYAHIVLEKQALELEKRTVQIREEELIAQIELAKIRTLAGSVSAENKSQAPLAKAVFHWTRFSLLSQPQPPSKLTLALTLLKLNSSLHVPKPKTSLKSFLKRVLTLRKHHERDLKRKYLHCLFTRGFQLNLHLFHQSLCSPSVSYLSIGDECSVRSPKALFQLKSMDFISDSNRNAALMRMEIVANRIRNKGIKAKQTSLLRWKVNSLTVEVKYYRTLMRSIDGLIQSIRRSEDLMYQEIKQAQGRTEGKIGQLTGLLEKLIGRGD